MTQEQGGALRSRIALGTVVLLLATLAVGVARATGDPRKRIRFNDASAWELDRSTGTSTHVNTSVGVLGASVSVGPDPTMTVEQAGAGVVVVDRSNQTMRVLDDATISIDRTGPKLAPGVQVRVSRDDAFVFDPKRGRLVVVPGAELGKLAQSTTIEAYPPAVDFGSESVGELGEDGTFHLIKLATGELASVVANGGRLGTTGKVIRRATVGALTPDAQLSALDEIPVVYVPRSQEVLVLTGKMKRLRVGSSAMALQMPSTHTKSVALADADGSVISVDRASGTIAKRVRAIGAEPIRPLVNAAGCIVALSQDAGIFGSSCPGQGPGERSNLPTGHEYQGRLVRGSAFVDDLDSGLVIVFGADGEIGVLRGKENEVTEGEKNGNNGDTRTNKDVDVKTVRTENVAPKPEPDVMRVRTGRTTLLPVLTNDTDPNHDELSVTDIALGTMRPDQGTAEIAPGGQGVLFRPSPGFGGTVSFQIEVSDPGGLSAVSSVKVTVNDTDNAAPKPADDEAKATLGHVALLDVVVNDVDPDNDSFAVTEARADTGLVSLGRNGLLSFRPSAEGKATITYTVRDERGLTGTGTATVDVEARKNTPPIVRDDLFEVPLSRTTSLDLLANDIDPDGDRLTITALSATDGPLGALTRERNLVRFNATQLGVWKFTYSVSDGEATQSATVKLKVSANAVNHPPLAVPDRALVKPGVEATVDVLLNDSDPDGDVLGVISWTAPPGVSVRSTDGRRLIVSAAQPLEQPAVVIYEVSDGTQPVPGTLLVSPALNVTNLAPIALPDTAGVRIGASRAINVLVNDVDPDGDPLTITRVISAPAGVGVSPQKRQILLDPRASTKESEFTYEIEDDSGNLAQATVKVNVVASAEANQVPALTADRATVRSGQIVTIPVLANDDDPEGDVLTIVDGGLPAKGRLSIAGNVLKYQANEGSIGTDRFVYLVDDGHGGRSTGEVTVGILPAPRANQPPIARDDAPPSVEVGKVAVIDVLANDSDPDNDPLRVASVDAPPSGSAEVAENKVRLTAPSKPGRLELRYSIVDPASASASAKIVLDVVEPKQLGKPPIARPDSAVVASATEQTIVSVLDNDIDPDGDRNALLVVSADGGATVGADKRTVVVSGAQKLVLYTIRDAQGNTAVGSISVSIGAASSLVLADDAATVALGASVEINVLDNDRVGEGDGPIRVVKVSASDGGTVTNLAGRKVRFDADRKVGGEFSFTYTAEDGKGNQRSANVRVTVTAPRPSNRPPVLKDADNVILRPGDARPIDLKDLASDPDKDPLAFAITAPKGSVTATLAGSVVSLTVAATAKPGLFTVATSATDPSGARANARIRIRIERPATTPGTTTTVAPNVAPTVPVTNPLGPDGTAVTATPTTETPTSVAVTTPAATTTEAPTTTEETTTTVEPTTTAPVTIPVVCVTGCPPTTQGGVTIITPAPTVPVVEVTTSAPTPPTTAVTPPSTPTTAGTPTTNANPVTTAATVPPGSVTTQPSTPPVTTSVSVSPTTSVTVPPTIPGVTPTTLTSTPPAGPTTTGTTGLPPITAAPTTLTTSPSTVTAVTTVPCPTPSGLSASNVRATEASLAWVGGPGNCNTFRVSLSPGGTSADTSATVFQLTNLAEATSYTVSVAACRNSQCGPTATASFTTLSTNVTGLTAFATSSTTMTVTWTAVAGATSYEVQRNGTLVSTQAGTSFSANGLNVGAPYNWQVRACTATPCTGPSSSVSAQTIGRPQWSNTTESTSDTLTLRWTYDGATATRFESVTNGVSRTTTTPTATFTGFAIGTALTSRARACTANGCGDWSTDWPNTVPRPVGAPAVVATAVGATQVNLTWTYSGGPITVLNVERNGTVIGQATLSNYAGGNGSHTANGVYNGTGLTAGTSYSWRIQACNGTTECAWSNAVTSTSTGTSPTGLVATATGSTGMALAWNSVSGATSYELQRDGTAAGSSSTTSFAATGLTPGTAYSWQVRACSATPCTGAWSAAVSAQTIGIPVFASGSYTSRSMTVNWSYSGVTAARWEFENNGTVVAANLTSPVHTISGLTPGSRQVSRARACISASVCGSWSNQWPTTLPQDIGAPVLSATPSATSVSLSWTYRGGPISVFYVERNGTVLPKVDHTYDPSKYDESTGWYPATGTVSGSLVVNGLTAGTSYTWRVQACQGTECTWSSPVTTGGSCNAPTGLTFSSQSTTGANVAWSAPSPMGCTFNTYLVTWGTPERQTTSTSTSLTGLTPATTYTVTVAACVASGACGTAVSGNVTTLPNAPTGLASSGVSTSGMTISWTAPSGTIHHYDVERNNTVVQSPTTASHAATGLTADTAYSWRVRACAGSASTTCGAYSAALSTRTSANSPPCQVGAPSVSITGTTTATITWAAPCAGSSPITSYNVRLNGSSVVSVGSTSYGWGGLTASTTYSWDVQACSSAGCGLYSPQTQQRTQDPPRTVTVSWGATVSIPVCNSNCRYMTVTFSNFAAGSHTIVCDSDVGGWSPANQGFYTYTTANTTSSVCVFGFANNSVRAYVDGVQSNDLLRGFG